MDFTDRGLVRRFVRLGARMYGQSILRDRNVVGLGCGEKVAHGGKTGRYGLTIFVAKKTPVSFLPISRMVPAKFSVGPFEIETDIVETGPFYPLELTARQRPAKGGISIGHVQVTAGTLGCLVRDNTDDTINILSNNHVIADQNDALIGDPIVQPGSFDGGQHPGDTIAQLKRFVTIVPEGQGVNRVDAAIAQPIQESLVVNEMNLGLAPPGPGHRVVGLLFAGSCNTMIMNPIQTVLQELDVSLLSGNSVTDGDVGLNVEKVGRTTEYTTSTIKTIDSTVRVQYDFGTGVFVDQFVTAWMSDGGDSGSVVFEGGAGGDEDRCGCPFVASLVDLLGLDLRQYETAARQFRDSKLRQTFVGSLLIDAYYKMQPRIQEILPTLNTRERATVRRVFERFYRAFADGVVTPGEAAVLFDKQTIKDLDQILRIFGKRIDRREYERVSGLDWLIAEFQGKTLGDLLKLLNSKRLTRSFERQLGGRG
jgi:hypothetical protein